MSDSIIPLSISVAPRSGSRYKSIATLSWTDIPGFAILTGRNGSGKTQLLELLAYRFSGALPPGTPPGSTLPVEVHVSDPGYKPEEIAFVPSAGRFSGGSPASLVTMSQTKQQVVQQVQSLSTNVYDVPSMVRVRRLQTRLNGLNLHQLKPEAIAEIFSDYDFATDDIDITAGLAHVFLEHRYKTLEALERGTPGQDEVGRSLGSAPWDVVNEMLVVAGFPYEVSSPIQTRLMDTYELRLMDRSSGVNIAAIDLSSGEKVLLQLALWLYTAGRKGLFPKLLLLDEPDAHLHPSMTTQFLDVISEVLVNRYGIRVIMTTHSPSTVALAPEGSVFQLDRGAASVARVDQRSEIISVLTAGLVTVSRATKFCFVEDEEDVAFYEAVRDILMDHGPGRDPMALRPSPSMAFIPASVGTGREKTSGGSTIVIKWVEKLDADPLNKTFFGIIDRDVANTARDRVQVLGRYSFENYLLDPLTLFCLLSEEGIAPSIPGLQISSGNEHVLRLQPDNVLQAVADGVTTRMEAASPCLATSATSLVTYTVGRQITVPSWVLNHRGHDLLQVAQAAFCNPRVVNVRRLLKALRRGRLVPTDLATTLAKVQCS